MHGCRNGNSWCPLEKPVAMQNLELQEALAADFRKCTDIWAP